MSSPTWDEYLREAAAHLSAMRASAERGGEPCAPPRRPDGLIPDERCDEAQRLSLGYDQLALEVATRITLIEQLRSSIGARNPHQEIHSARYIDTPA